MSGQSSLNPVQTVNDSPHPHASLMFGFLKANLELYTYFSSWTACGIANVPQCILLPIHLTADDGEQRLRVDEHPDPVLFDDLIESARFLHVFKVI
jgi:hypothetical protein